MVRQKSVVDSAAGKTKSPLVDGPEVVDRLAGLVLGNRRQEALALAERLDDRSSQAPGSAENDPNARYEYRNRFLSKLFGEEFIGDRFGDVDASFKLVLSNLFFFHDLGTLSITPKGISGTENVKLSYLYGSTALKEELQGAITALGVGKDYLAKEVSLFRQVPPGFAEAITLIGSMSEESGLKLSFYSSAEEHDRRFKKLNRKLSIITIKQLYTKTDSDLKAYLEGFGLRIDENQSKILQLSSHKKKTEEKSELDFKSRMESAELQVVEISKHLRERRWQEAIGLSSELDKFFAQGSRINYADFRIPLKWTLISSSVTGVSAGDMEQFGASFSSISRNISIFSKFGLIGMVGEPEQAKSKNGVLALHLMRNPDANEGILAMLIERFGMSGESLKEYLGILSKGWNFLCVMEFLWKKVAEQSLRVKFYADRVVNIPPENHDRFSLTMLHRLAAPNLTNELLAYFAKNGIKTSEEEYGAFKRDFFKEVGVAPREITRRESVEE